MELKETIDLMCSSNYKERFIAEYRQTKIRFEKLSDFCNKIEVETMLGKEVTKHDCPLQLLREQQKYMRLYLSILEKRALIENIKLDDKFTSLAIAESKEPVLYEEERKYLSEVIRPFRNHVTSVRKWFNGIDYQILISLDNADNLCQLPRFPLSSEMYKGMDSDKWYSLQELGL